LDFASFRCIRDDLAMMLLDKDRDVAYMKDTKGRAALIVSRCSYCFELVDNRGWNILHFAIKGAPYCYCQLLIFTFYCLHKNQFNNNRSHRSSHCWSVLMQIIGINSIPLYHFHELNCNMQMQSTRNTSGFIFFNIYIYIYIYISRFSSYPELIITGLVLHP
jgi:hypothetical protein